MDLYVEDKFVDYLVAGGEHPNKAVYYRFVFPNQYGAIVTFCKTTEDNKNWWDVCVTKSGDSDWWVAAEFKTDRFFGLYPAEQVCEVLKGIADL